MQSWRTFGARGGAWPALILLLGAYLLLALAYGAATPDLEAPDAGAHFRYVAWLQDHPQLPPYDLPTALVSHELVQQPPLYYALVAGLSALVRPQVDLQATVDYEQAVLTPYFEKGLGKRATVSPPDTDPAVVWPLRVARAGSLAGGLLMVVATFVLAATLLPCRRALPLAITAAVAFNPQFLFTSTTITNDVWAAALATAAVAAGAQAAARQARPWAWCGVGALCGLAMLAKYSGVMTLLPVALLAILLRPPWNWHDRATNRQVFGALLRQGAFTALGFFVVTGFLLAHNVTQTGELFPMQPIRTLLPGLIRPEPLAAGELGERLAFLTRSYTGIFGYGVRASAGFYELVDASIWLAALGWGILLGKASLRRWRGEAGADSDLLRAGLLALLWVGALVGSLAIWIRIMIAGEQGRLLFPAAAAVATLLVAGWIGWLPRRSHGVLSAAVGAGLLAVGIWQLATVQNVYATPPPLPEPVMPSRVVNATFAPGMRLLGFDLPAGAATEPGRPLPLTLYFTAAAPVPEDYTLFLHLTGPGDRMLYQFDGIPYGNRHPPRQWRVGEVFADHYVITPTVALAGAAAGTSTRTDTLIGTLTGTITSTLPGTLPGGSTLATLSLGFYPVLRPADRAAVVDASGAPAGDRLQLAPIRILPPGSLAQLAAGEAPADAATGPTGTTTPGSDAPAANAAGTAVPRIEAGRPELARWQNGIVLQSIAVLAEQDGSPQTIELRWQTDQLLSQDFTVFVQALDADGNLAGQVDRQPQDGAAPTSTWLAGEQIADQVTFAAPPAAWQQIIVGLYDAAGRRLPLAVPETGAAGAGAAGDAATTPGAADYFVALQRPS
jgi:hypothetical protein